METQTGLPPADAHADRANPEANESGREIARLDRNRLGIIESIRVLEQ